MDFFNRRGIRMGDRVELNIFVGIIQKELKGMDVFPEQEE